MKNRNLTVVVLVMLINALSYGTIIPLLYPYASRFGISASGLGFLFASFSLAQFIATPVMGRLSDKFGRKPLLVISLFGTALSLAIFASAKTAVTLFIARALDGITGGNISVAQAVISDTTKKEDRAKSFAMLGAVFGFGFVFGPAIGGYLSPISLSAPFWFSSSLALFATILAIFILGETNVTKQSEVSFNKLFDFTSMKNALLAPTTGMILLASFFALLSQNVMIIGFQSYIVDVLTLSPKRIGIIYTMYGIVGILMQTVGIRVLLGKFKSKTSILGSSLLLSALVMFPVSLSLGYGLFLVFILSYGAIFSVVQPVITSLLSERTKKEDQGGILGFNQAYTSVAQIVGPVTAGIILKIGTQYVFFLVSILLLFSYYWSRKIVFSGEKVDL